jgi:dihydroneopterin aldolase
MEVKLYLTTSVSTIIGVRDSERIHPQEIGVEVKLVVRPPVRDALIGCVDYSAVLQQIRQRLVSGGFYLLEVAAMALAQELMAEPGVIRGSVTLRKEVADGAARAEASW